jgi:lysozyme family protein
MKNNIIYYLIYFAFSIVCIVSSGSSWSAEFDKAIPIVLKHEGVLSDNKRDPGGVTKYGLSYRFLDDLIKRHPKMLSEIDANSNNVFDYYDVQNLSIFEAKKIYKEEWWDVYHYERFKSQALANKIFDISINIGQKECEVLVKRAINSMLCENRSKDYIDYVNMLTDDGAEKLMMFFEHEVIVYYTMIVKKHPSYKVFLKGWIRRVVE